MLAKSFTKGFEKQSSLLHVLGILGLPSVEKRVATKSFEYSKRKALGLPVEESKIFNSIDKHIAKADKVSPGIKKKVLDFAMDEGPGVIVYTPARQGKQLGATLNNVADSIPFLGKDKIKIKEFLSKLTHSDPKLSGEAMEELSTKLTKVKTTGRNIGLGALGVLGAALLANQVLKKEEGANPLHSNFT